MPDAARLLRRALSLPPHVIVRKALRVARRKREEAARRGRHLRETTFSATGPDTLQRRFLSPAVPSPTKARAEACRHYLAHRFEVLGSGWLTVERGMTSPGVEGRRYPARAAVDADPAGDWLVRIVNVSNIEESKRRWSLVSAGYRPVDWCIDIKSGLRWPESAWVGDVRYGNDPGVDVKVPWELSRAHHLPQLALLAIASGGTERDRLGREVCDQILDFSATNPPHFGPNWLVSMDIGIRVANWCVAIDLLKAAGFTPTPEVEAAIARSVHEHARFIAGNLEWFPHMRSNHYLGNLVGLVFSAAYLPAGPETDSWLSFGAASLVEEMARQFEPDGGNFEGSTAYHRLSTEMVVWCLAVLRSLPSERASRIGRWDSAHIDVPQPPAPVSAEQLHDTSLDEVLVRAGWFALDSIRPDGRIVQFGDCDSGRLFKFAPVMSMMSSSEQAGLFANLDGWTPPEGPDAVLPLEDHLDVRHLASAIGVLTGDGDLEAAGGDRTEAAVMRALVGVRSVGGDFKTFNHPATAVRVGDSDAFASELTALGAATSARRFDAAPGLCSGLECAGYPEFGLWVWRSSRLYLAVRCGSVGQYGAAGHVHNDQLAMELWIDGEPAVMDPGTYLYTPLPARRNEYRSVAAHDAPAIRNHEPGDLRHGLFQIEGARPGTCRYFGKRGFWGSHEGYGIIVSRLIEVRDDAVIVHDVSKDGTTPGAAADVPEYSPGYGMRLRPGTVGRFLKMTEERE